MPADDHPSIIHFGWDLTYACNYDCSYCKLPSPAKPRPISDWIRVWDRLYKKYGRCYIYMSGGEPAVYPGFYDLIKQLISIHTIDLCTNLSWEVERLTPELDPKYFKISPTFHPSQVSLEEFLPKAVHVRNYLPKRFPPNRSVYYVMDPKQIQAFAEFKERFEEMNLILIPLPLMEEKDIANDEEEKKTIEDLSPNKNTWDKKLDYQLKNLVPNEKNCHAGQRYALIRGDGMVDRCTRYEDRQVGNIFDENFALFTEPKICCQEWCPFESQWIVRKNS